ncbi:GDP-mannose 4,6-dehydratase, partial [Ahrensia marina]
AGYTPVILDNFSNSSSGVLDRLNQLFQQEPVFIEGDIRSPDLVQKTLEDHECESVIHFAGYKAVGESMAEPLK